MITVGLVVKLGSFECAEMPPLPDTVARALAARVAELVTVVWANDERYVVDTVRVQEAYDDDPPRTLPSAWQRSKRRPTSKPQEVPAPTSGVAPPAFRSP